MAGWQIKGEYMETCNCTLLCPCIWSNLAAQPTEGDCKAAVTLRIDKGAKDGVTLAGICVLAPDQGLRIDSGTRHMGLTPADLKHYAGSRAQRGLALPRGWRTVDRLTAE